MSPKIPVQADNIDLRYSNLVNMIFKMVKPKNLYVVAGRGTGKTTDILSERMQDIAYDMPGCYFALSSDTYMNALKNVIPALIEGWERNGWIEGVHFVVGDRPPEHFKKPYKPPQMWKHTITIHTGMHIKLISMDRPSTGAGDSYQHVGGDEIKYQPEQKINKLTPAIRGEYVRFGNSVYYRGRTFTTDMPNTNHNEHDWILRMRKNMNVEQIKLILQAAFVVNDIRKELYHAEEAFVNADTVTAKAKAKKTKQNIERKLERWEERYTKVRKNSTVYAEISSYANADVLTADFFQDLLDTTLFGEFKTSVLTIQPTLEKGQMFYPNLTEANFYTDGYTYSNIDKQVLTKKGIETSSLDLKYCRHTEPLEAGLDTGKMCSLAVGQYHPDNTLRILKDFHTLPPEFLPELGAEFRYFFRNHKNKTLILWHDRATNNLQAVGEDHASKMKKAIEYNKDNNLTGWTCTLMSRNQAVITQQQEFELMLAMCLGDNGLPTLMIDKNECKVTKSSMEKAKLIIKTDQHGKKTIHKDKSSEKLPNERLPLESTNMSDGVKYLCCTPENLEKIKGNNGPHFHGDPGVY